MEWWNHLLYCMNRLRLGMVVDIRRYGQADVTLKNSTKYDAKVKILAESGDPIQKSFYQTSWLKWKEVDVQAGKTINVKLK